MIRSILTSAALLALLPTAPHADPLHALANDAYWHHDSNFVFPARLAEFTRVGAPQEVDGTTTVVAHYAHGVGESRVVVVIEVVPLADVAPEPMESPARTFVRTLDRAGWRITVRAPVPTGSADAGVDALLRALPVERLGAVDVRCPNAGCGD